jgi:hypothetical protein
MVFVWIRGAQMRCAEKSPFTLSSLGGLDLVSHSRLGYVKGHPTQKQTALAPESNGTVLVGRAS